MIDFELVFVDIEKLQSLFGIGNAHATWSIAFAGFALHHIIAEHKMKFIVV